MSFIRDKIRIFDYTDYRQYVRDRHRHAKKTRKGYSHRAFAKKAGLKTSNFMMLVVQGKRNLTEESLQKFVLGLELNRQEEEYFRNLVYFNQAKTASEKDFYYQRLFRSRKVSQVKSIERRQYEYYSAWYHPVVRELVASRDFDGTPDWIARRLYPTVPPAQVAKSIRLLESLGLIKKTRGRKWKQTSPVLTTGPELTSLVVHNYHKALLDLSKTVMDLLTMKNRDVSAVTLGVRRTRIPELRAKVREFRREMLKAVSDETEPEEVLQLNIQFYPVTKMPDEK